MRLFLSVDMEGTTRLERLEEIFRGLPGYDTFRQLMAGDANAVVRGAIEGGATEIVVSDSHGYMCNIYPNDLTPGVLLKRGLLNRQWCQMKTFDGSFDAVIMIGYHAKAGSSDAILAHTWITGFRDVRVNGLSVPEPALNGYLAGSRRLFVCLRRYLFVVCLINFDRIASGSTASGREGRLGGGYPQNGRARPPHWSFANYVGFDQPIPIAPPPLAV